MADLGTLWFGADIDLTKLKQKINSGNQSVLDALKMNYDEQSYQQMVSKLRTALDRETFKVKIVADENSVAQNLRRSLSSAGGRGFIGNLDEMNAKILAQTEAVNRLKERLLELQTAYNINKKGTWAQQMTATGQEKAIASLKAELAGEQRMLRDMIAQRQAYRNSTQDNLLALRQERAEYRKVSDAAKQFNSDHIRLNTTLANGIHISTRLGSALSTLFAVSQARDFLQNVIEIGGQLEKQRISMQAILGDTARANQLFEQIKDLAVRSPFGVVQLDQYSKQLAAYGIEQSDLYNMTKRLADISAGAGQDIGRLALALGHVKSATYLTGMTLRQFSMNNIPMLKMLADYYSEVEKRAVSTAEVQKRISKRQVSYEDVIEQIKRMTDEGGQFYNMQEKISESLQARFKNLKDSFDIMYGEIAESSIGDMLKSFAAGATDLSRNWKQVALVLGVAAAQFGVMRLSAFAVNQAVVAGASSVGQLAFMTRNLNAEQVKELVVSGRLEKNYLLQAVAVKRLTVEQAKEAAAYYGVTEAQLQQIATSGKVNAGLVKNAIATSAFSMNQLRLIASMKLADRQLSIFGRRFKWLDGLMLRLRITSLGLGNAFKTVFAGISRFVPQLAFFAGLSLVMDTFMDKTRKAEEQEQRMKDMTEMANEAFKNLSETSEKFKIGASGGMSDDELQTNITEMVEHLKNYQKTAKDTFNNAFKVDADGKAVHSLSEQYEILAKAIDETSEAYRTFNEIKSMVEHAMHVNDPDEGFLQGLGNRLYGWTLSDSYKTSMRDLTESLEFYVESVQKASVAEQMFLRDRLNIQGALFNLGYKEALDMDNEALLRFINTLRNSPEEYRKFYQMLDNGGKSALNSMTMAWNTMNKSFAEANQRMRKTGEDLYETLVTKFGTSDVAKWPAHWRETVMIAMDLATKDVKGFADLSIDYQNMVRNSFLKPFAIEVDSSEAQTQVNNLLVELQNLVGTDWTVQIGIKGTNSIEDLDAASKSYSKAVEGLNTLADSRKRLEREGRTETEAYKRIIADEKDLILMRDKSSQVISQYGGVLPTTKKNKPSGKSGGTKTDSVLKRWEEELRELESFYKIYKRNVEYMSKDDAIQKALSSGIFPDPKKLPTNIDDYLKVLQNFRDRVQNEMGKNPSSERKNFLTELLTKIDEKVFEEETKEVAEAMLRQLDEELKKAGKSWDLYKKILDATGNRKQAETIAFGRHIDFSNFAEQLRSDIEQSLENLPAAKAIGVDKLLGMDDKGLENVGIFEKSTDGIYKKLQQLKEAMQDVKSEEVDLLLDALKNAKSLDTELDQIRLKYDKTRKAINSQYSSPEQETERNRLLGNADKNEAREIADKQWEYFKKNEEWGRIFSNLDNISTQTLEHMLKKLRELAPTIADSTEGTKALYEAIDKIQDKLTERNPFAAAFGALQRGNRLRQLYDDVVSKRGSFTPDARSAKYYGLQEGRTYTKNEIRDLIKQAGTDFTKGLEGLAAGFKAVQDVLGPVIDLFDALGNEDLSNFFAMGSNALGSAAQVASGLESLGLGAAGPYAAAAAAGLSVVSSLIAMHDKTLQKEIEASEQRQREMENLTRNLETALERTLGGIYNTKATKDMLKSLREGIEFSFLGQSFGYRSYVGEDTKKAVEEAEKSRSYYDAAYASLLAQRDELQHQRDTELSKKNTDDDKIADYKQQLTEMDDEIKHFAEDMAKAIYDIDVKSWASDLGDALFEAWQKGEDGAEAFRKKASEIIADVAKKIAVTKLIETAMQPVLDVITSEMERTNGQLDERSVEAISAQMAIIGGTLPTAFNNLMDGLNAGMQKAGLEDMRSIGTESASSMTNSIKGVTETTADLLASYINAIRADVSVNRMTLTEILYAVQGQTEMPMIARAQLQQLEQVAANTQRNADAAEMIYEMLNQNVLGALPFRVK